MRFTAFSSTTFFAEQRHLARYFLVGGAAAVVDIGLFVLFAQYFGLPYLRVAPATFVIATLVNYLLSVRFVFVSGRRHRRGLEILLVYLVSIIGLALNQLILAFCVEIAHLALFLAKITATGLVFFWNYISRRMFIFEVRTSPKAGA